jgi:hypothetical protein
VLSHDEAHPPETPSTPADHGVSGGLTPLVCAHNRWAAAMGGRQQWVGGSNEGADTSIAACQRSCAWLWRRFPIQCW